MILVSFALYYKNVSLASEAEAFLYYDSAVSSADG